MAKEKGASLQLLVKFEQKYVDIPLSHVLAQLFCVSWEDRNQLCMFSVEEDFPALVTWLHRARGGTGTQVL